MTTLANVSPSTSAAPMSLLADAAFRAKLEQDPVAAFASVGIAVEAPKQVILPEIDDADDRVIHWRGLLG